METVVEKNKPLGTKILDINEEALKIKKYKEELQSLLHEKLIRNCRNDPNNFIDYVGSFNEDHWLGQATIHLRWNKALNDHKNVLLITPREHGKTTQIILRIVWEIGKNPNLRIKLVCQSDNTAIKRLIAIIDLIENNPRVQEIFPELRAAEKGTWTKSKIYVMRSAIGLIDPSIEAVGIFSTATGGRGDLLVFDDPVDFRNAIQQPALREVIKEIYRNVWMNIVEKHGRVWYIATPWHKADLTHELLEKDSYFKITDSINNNFDPIWPENWNRKRLIEKLESIGRRAFDRAFRNKALTDEDAVFTEDMIEKNLDKSFKFGELPITFTKENVKYFAGVDIGGGKGKKREAYSVMFTIAVMEKMKVPISIVRGKYSSPQFTKLIIDELLYYNHEMLFVENNATQGALIQWIEEVSSEIILPPIKGYFTGQQKMSDDIGLPGMAVEFEHGSWKIPDNTEHSKPCKCNLCVWIDEMLNFPVGRYSDTLMASWFAREANRSMMTRMPRVTIIGDEEDED